ncbi:MAG: hypothetical protein LBQ42_13365 [Synergistaceae bacterium]|jgi:hypothetical protein|nr:hypothetical protein [Synergistaceae bacterium]
MMMSGILSVRRGDETNMSWKDDLETMGRRAREAARLLATTPTEVKNAAL